MTEQTRSVEYVILRETSEDYGTRKIDYERMAREMPLLRARRNEAVAAGDVVRLAEECVKAIRVWEECGAWPDNWSEWQRALDDLLHWRESVLLEELATGRVKIVRPGDVGEPTP